MAATEAATDLGCSRRSQDATATLLVPHSGNSEAESIQRGVKPTRSKDDDEIVEITLDARAIDEGGSGHGGGFDGVSVVLPSSSRSGNLTPKLTQVKNGLKEADEVEKEGATDTIGKENVEEIVQKSAAVTLKGLQLVTLKAGHVGWAAVEKRFDQLQVDGVLLRSRFGECIGIEEGSDEFAMQVFDSLSSKRGIVTKDELKCFWEQLSAQSFDNRLRTFFDIVDKNADGRITPEEVKEIITFGASANKIPMLKERVDEYTALIMEELDPDNLGYIKLEDLEALLLQSPAQAFASSTELASNKDTGSIYHYNWQEFMYFLEENWKRIWVMTLWLCICIGLFIWKFIQYRNRDVFHILGYCVSTAKGGAEILKFNMGLILFPVCRITITWIRSKTKIGVVLPFNDTINFHKVIAAGVVVGVALHAGGHLTCNFPRLLHASESAYEPMKPFFGDKRPPNYWWFLKGTEGWTGVAMVILMTIAFVLALPWFRHNKLKDSNPLKKMTGFNTFWFTHHLFIFVYVLLIVHGISLYLSTKWYKKTTWMYLAVPLLLYVIERILRIFWSHGAVTIQKVVVYPGNCLALFMSKPRGFRYRSGQYVFINCSAVSRYEWHPFSITSAPGDDYLSIHIRAKGDWTKRLRNAFVRECRPPTDGKSGLLRADLSKGITERFPKIFIDGPYGAPAQDYREYDVVLLIGLGIGATPLISIVKDMLHQIQQGGSEAGTDTEPETSVKAKKRPFMTKRAYFFWVTRELGSFEWFQGVMKEVDEKDKDGVLELNSYCSSIEVEGDSRSALIALLRELQHDKKEEVTFCRSSVRTYFGRPKPKKWRDVFKHVALNHENQRVGVFYCGEPVLVPELRKLSADFNHKTNTKFEFHKENF